MGRRRPLAVVRTGMDRRRPRGSHERRGVAARKSWKPSAGYTLGHPAWDAPGARSTWPTSSEAERPLPRRACAFLARCVPGDFDGVFSSEACSWVLEWTLREGKPVFPETAALWNQVL